MKPIARLISSAARPSCLHATTDRTSMVHRKVPEVGLYNSTTTQSREMLPADIYMKFDIARLILSAARPSCLHATTGRTSMVLRGDPKMRSSSILGSIENALRLGCLTQPRPNRGKSFDMPARVRRRRKIRLSSGSYRGGKGVLRGQLKPLTLRENSDNAIVKAANLERESMINCRRLIY